LVLAVGCGGIQNINQFASAPAHQGSVEIRAVPQSSTGTLLFEMRVENPAGTTGIPSGSLLQEVKAEAARRGANVLIFNCAAPGTVQFRVCRAQGYRE
jgi:hypothetical protein